MASEQPIDRSMLAGKDREQLTEIAAAMGMRGISRLRKAELVDAILAAANGEPTGTRPAGNGTGDTTTAATTAAPAKRAVRSKKASELAQDEPSIEALVAEEDAIAAAAPPVTETLPARRATPVPATPGPTGAPAAPSDMPAGEAATATSVAVPPDERAGFGENRAGSRRRRRRGRNRGVEERVVATTGAEAAPVPTETQEVTGFLDLRDDGYGFLRTSGYLPSARDIYVSASLVRRFGLRKGDRVRGQARAQATSEKYPAMLRVDEVNGLPPEEAARRPRFEDLTPLFPDERLRLELRDEPTQLTGRIVDLLAPIGKGQRGLIVSPPKAGKTTILKQIVYAIERNNPEVHLMVLLVDERPEEVTDMRRHVLRGEVIASTFDRPADEHTQVAELTIERAKRLVETGKDVVIVLDGITRLARAYNLAAPASGRILSGGVDSTALYPPKRFFGAARNIEEGGSLTIVATALIETGSRMDEVIFEEFKGTGNMELRLDRRLAERRLYPAIDVNASSTRHEELLFERSQLQQVWKLRRVLNALAQDGSSAPGLELLIDKLRSTRSNDEFLAEIAKAPTPGG